MTDEQKKQLNEFVEHIRFKHNENMNLDKPPPPITYKN